MEFVFTPDKIMLLMSKPRLKALETYWTQNIRGVDCVKFT